MQINSPVISLSEADLIGTTITIIIFIFITKCSNNSVIHIHLFYILLLSYCVVLYVVPTGEFFHCTAVLCMTVQ